MAKIFLKILDLEISYSSALEMGMLSLAKLEKTGEDFALKSFIRKSYHLVD